MSPELTARLQACDIQVAAQAREYSMFVRGNCAALVRCEGDCFTSLGSSGMMTENGLAYLVWNNGQPMLASHGNQVPADPDQVKVIQEFSEDLKKAIWAADERR